MLLNEIIWGLLCAVMCIIPGWSIAISAYLGLLVPNAVVYAVAGGLIIKTYTESRSSLGSGNIYTTALCGVVSFKKNYIFPLLLRWKVIMWIVGLLLGMYLVPEGIKGTIMPAYIIFILLGLALYRKKTSVIKLAIWLVLIMCYVLLLEILEVPYPITIVGVTCFIIPEILQIYKKEKVVLETEYLKDVAAPNLVTVIISAVVALCSPGVSAQAVLGSFRQGIVSKYMSSIIIESLIESIALGQLLNNNNLGKAMIGSMMDSVNSSVAIASIGVVLICAGIIKIIDKHIKMSINYLEKTAPVVGIATVFIMTGISIYTIGFIAIGFILNIVSSKLELPEEGKAFTFLGLLT